MSAAAPLPNTLPLAVPPASISDPPPPPVTDPPSSQPNLSAPPPAILSAPPPATQSPPPVVIAAPPPATPPTASLLPPPSVIAPPPLKPASAPPPPPSEVVSPPPTSEVVSPPPPSEIVSPTPPSEIVSPPPPSEVVSLPPPISPPPPTPPTDPHESSPPPFLSPPPPPPTSRPPSLPSPASEPPTSSPPPPASTTSKSSPTTPSPNPPPPPNSKQPQTSPPPPRKSLPTTHSPPTSPPKSPSVNPPPPPSEPITPSESPPSPSSTPPSLPSFSPTNSSMNVSPPTALHLAPPPLVISPPSLNSNPYAPEKSNSGGKGGTNAAIGVGIGVSLGVIALGLIIMIIWCVYKRKKEASLDGHYIVSSSYGSSHKADSTLKVKSSAPLLQNVLTSDVAYSSREPGGLGHTRSWFAYEELVVATNGFSPENLLGEGGFGYVYKGYLPNERVIAVKQLKIGGGQGEREFKAEVELISRIHHRHLVSLVGYCVADNRRLLVYDYVPNNNLYFHLHGEGRLPMIWATRVRVAAGTARGLAYLHEDCHPRIIHRDVKSSNILLDNNFDARVSDFGLAKLALDSYSHVTTRVMGTFGYMAPEYAASGKLTEKSDVYSFGVVLLELITGRKPVDASQPSGDESLVEWARPLLVRAIETAEVESLVDPRLEKNYVDAEMFRMIEAAAACVRHAANKRPRMGQVVRFFDSLLAADITSGMQMGQSQVYDSAEHSAEIRLFRKMAFGSQNYNSDFFSDDSRHHDDTRRLENGGSFSNLHNETTYILEVDLESDNQTTVLVSHLHS